MQYKKISEIGTVITGKTPSTKKPEYFNGEIPFATPEDIAKGYKLEDTKRHLSESGFESIKNNTFNGPSILVGCIGSDMGNVAFSETRFSSNQQINTITKIKKGIDPLYVYYFLSTRKEYLRSIAGSTATPLLPKSVFENVEIILPNFVSQKKISYFLTIIDEKIKTNRKISEKLEQLAKEIYEYWFIQFDFPDENGRPYKSSGGKMVWNESLKREIPEGWKVENLMNTSLCSDIKAGVDYFEKKNYLPTACVNDEEITDGDYVTFENRESRANMQPIKNSVWFAKMKNSVKHLSIPSCSDWFIEKYILSTGFQGIKCEANSFPYIHCLINSEWFELYKDQLSHGATQESVNNTDLKNIRFVVPNANTLSDFAEICNPILEMKFSLIEGNQELTSLRDWILPMLMNGQVKVME